MAGNKKVHVMVFGPVRGADGKVTHSVDDVMTAVTQAAGKVGAAKCVPVGKHGDFARPHQVSPGHPDFKEEKGAEAGADIELPEKDLDQLTGLLNQIPNIQFEVSEAA